MEQIRNAVKRPHAKKTIDRQLPARHVLAIAFRKGEIELRQKAIEVFVGYLRDRALFAEFVIQLRAGVGRKDRDIAIIGAVKGHADGE